MTSNSLEAAPKFFKLDHSPTLQEAQDLVDGYVQLVELYTGDQLLVDEDGIAKGLPLNSTASFLAGQPIVGNVVFLQGTARWK